MWEKKYLTAANNFLSDGMLTSMVEISTLSSEVRVGLYSNNHKERKEKRIIFPCYMAF